MPATYRFGPFALERASRLLLQEGTVIPLTVKAFETLLVLVEQAGQTVDKGDLMRAVWPDTVVEEANLTQQIFLIRKALGEGPCDHRYIVTVPRRGYRFVAPVSAIEERTETREGPDEPLPAPALHLRLSLDAALPMALGAARPFSLSPHGTALAYVGHEEQGTALYVRTLDRLRTFRIKGSEGALAPFFSPDGRWVAFFARGVLWKVFGTEGSPIPLCETEADPRGGTWGRSDLIVFAASPAAPLSRIDANGGQPAALTTLDFAAGERTHRWPDMLPSGREVLFTVASAGSASFDEANIWSVSLETGARRLVQRLGSCPHFVPTGHLLYMRGGSIMAVPFDADDAVVRGAPVPVASGVMTLPTGAGQMAVADTGLLAYLEGEFHNVDRRLTWITAEGVQDSPLPSLPFEEPRLSPAASHVAVGVRRSTNDIWIGDCAAGTLQRLTFEGDNFAPIWTPDGQAITFSSNRDGPCNLYQVAIGGGAAAALVTSEFDLVPGSWTPDGETLLFTLYHPDSGADIFKVRPADGMPPAPLLRTPRHECAPMVSPDGRAFAFASDESGRFEIYVMPLDGPGPPRQISRHGGWSPSGAVTADSWLSGPDPACSSWTSTRRPPAPRAHRA